MNKAKILEVLEDNNFWYDLYKDEIEFGQHTPCGEDWFEHLDFKSAKQFINDLEDRINFFDVDEEIEVWIPIRGTRGVPEKITDLVEDAEWKKEQLEELLKNLTEV